MFDFYLKPVKFFAALNVALCLFLGGCAQSSKKIDAEDNSIKEIAVLKNISNIKDVNLSSIATDIEYCVLETNDNCLVTNRMQFYCSEDYIVCMGSYRPLEVCYVFERKTGKFVRQISSKGQGPGEYNEVISRFWDEKNEQVCLLSHPNYMFYNIDGTLSHKINRDEHAFFSPSFMYNDVHVRYMPNVHGDQNKRIVFHDRTGGIIDSIPNFRTWNKILTMTVVIYGEAKFHSFSNELYYTDMYCDTLYHVKNNTLQPRYIFDVGGLTVPYEMHSWTPDKILAHSRGENAFEKYVVIKNIFEDTKYLYFTIDYRSKLYPAIYEKKEDVLQIMPPITITPQERAQEWLYPLYGFKNDLDGGLLFWPEQMILEKEMMCVYTAEELLELDVSKITDMKLKNVLENIDIDSNPVVAIVTLKN